MKTHTIKKLLTLIILMAFNTASSHPFTPCDENGMADFYPCQGIDLMHRVHIDHMGGTDEVTGSDIWGWTDPETSKEYALMTMSDGTSFVDITDPINPIYVGRLPTASFSTLWRDVKTYNNYAYIVSEAANHGMQVFDLRLLRDVTEPPVTFSETAIYNGFSSAHNIVINEDSGFAYAVGTNSCSGGLHMINLQKPAEPTSAGCFSEDGYTHDAQCVNYIGPDKEHNTKEICFNANEDTITIVDVTDKESPVMLSRNRYSGSQYTHQGWLTEDQRYFLMNDELDEQNLNHKTKTYIWDMLNLENPQLLGFYSGPGNSIDHNLYIRGNQAYLSNYTSGLRILDISNIGSGQLEEVAYFDTYPTSDSASFNGTWSNYPFFPSGNIILSDFDGGLFIFKQTNVCPTVPVLQELQAEPTGDNRVTLNWALNLEDGQSYNVYRAEGGCSVNSFEKIADGITTSSFVDNTVSGQVPVGYRISTSSPFDGQQCESERSVCVEVQTTGTCTAAPLFNGVITAQSADTSRCGMNIEWSNASSQCGGEITYDLFKSPDPEFIPEASNRFASNITGNNWQDFAVETDTEYYYLARATDQLTGKQDTNMVKVSDIVQGPLKNGTWSAGAEVGDTGFNQTTRHVSWEQTSTQSNTGSRSYWSQNNSNSCQALTTQSLQLNPKHDAVLEFWSAHDIDFRFDGGVVEIDSGDGVWQSVDLMPDYPSQFRLSNNSCGYESGEPSFTGTDMTWRKHELDLSPYRGKNIQLRWNYSSNSITNGQGWFIDDISVSNVQTPSQCETIEQSIQPGLWFDATRNGHGFAIEPMSFDDLYYTVFYTYDDQGLPEWYVSLTTLEDGILNRTSQPDTLQRFLYDYSIDPINGNLPIRLDEQLGPNGLSIDFNSLNVEGTSETCTGQAQAYWQIDEQQDQWCLQPLIAESSYPTPDLGGTWWSGNDDSGWGLSLAFQQQNIIAVVYYYDASGNPRWVIGQAPGFEIGQTINVDLFEVRGYGRTQTPIETQNILAGQLSMTLNKTDSTQSDGIINLDVTYQGTQGGQWSRSEIAINNFTQVHN